MTDKLAGQEPGQFAGLVLDLGADCGHGVVKVGGGVLEGGHRRLVLGVVLGLYSGLGFGVLSSVTRAASVRAARWPSAHPTA